MDREVEESGGEKTNKLVKEETAHNKGEQSGMVVYGENVEGPDDDIDTDTSENTIDKMNDMRNKGNPWRDSGYITSDDEDSIIEKFNYKTEIDDKKQERIPSIFVF